MRVSLGVNNKPEHIFDSMLKPEKNNYKSCLKPQKPDTFEFQNIKEKIKENKKSIILAGVILAGITGAFLIKKNIGLNSKQIISSAIDTPQRQSETGGIMEEFIKQAKTLLIDDVKNGGEASVNGICFYGPDSKGKEEVISAFLEDIGQAGYKIEHAPRMKGTSSREIGGKITELMKKAEDRFKTTKQRTAIVVRDLDKIAAERRLDDGKFSGAVSSLIQTQECRKRGYAWISEAVDFQKVDVAVARGGRMEYRIPVRPSILDSKEVWSQYIEMIEKFKEGVNKDRLLQEAKEIIKMKGI